MKIITLVDPQPYSRLTVNRAIQGLAETLQCEYKGYELKDRIEPDSSQAIFIFESALVKIKGVTTAQIRRLLPNTKLVCLSGDACIYQKGYRHPIYESHLLTYPEENMEFKTPYEVDLFVDLMDCVIEDYEKKGIRCDSWTWTTSQWLLDYLETKQKLDPQKKEQDFIALFTLQPTGDRGYRPALIRYLREAGKTVQNGGLDYNPDNTFLAYSRSRYVLGTSSPSWHAGTRTMKGYRDWLGSPCGTVLIYDDFDQVAKKYPVCPLYEYDNFKSILNLIESIDYQKVLATQQQWIKENTIDQQLYRLLIKHNLLEGTIPNKCLSQS